MNDHERAYTYHKAKASAYARAGLSEKARSHANRARAYAFGGATRAYAFGGAEKTHRIFVLSPLNDLVAAKLRDMVADAGQNYAHVEVYIQGFSEPSMHPGVCGAEPSNWKDAKCTNLLPAQFNQYCSDDPLALVKLINAHKTNKKVKFVIMPTQLTKNIAFHAAVVTGHKSALTPETWDLLDDHTKRKILSWHKKNFRDSSSLRVYHKFTSFEPLFDPFVAYMISKDRSGEANKTKLSRVAVEVDESDLGMPVMREASGDDSNVELVYHASTADAAWEGAAYAEYVWKALSGKVGLHDDNDKFVNSVVQDWADWDNLVSVRCILYSLPGDLALYSVGRPIAPWASKCKLDYGATYTGGLRPWPPCAVDEVETARSSQEAIDVAATWYTILRDWKKEDPNRRSLSVSNYGYTNRHGMNPAAHSPIVDIYTVHADRHEKDQGSYVGLLANHETLLDRFSRLGIMFAVPSVPSVPSS